MGNGNVPPTAEDLKNASYIYKGRPYRTKKLIHSVNDDDLYNKDIFIEYYERHNKNLIDYFKHRPEDLLVINLKEKDSYSKFCNFLRIEQKKNEFPWENKT